MLFTVLVALSVLVVILQVWWRRKEDRQWKLLSQFPGDRPWPLVGNALQIGSDIDAVSHRLMDIWRRHGRQNYRVTIGSQHWVLLSDPVDIGIILSHQTELSKTPERNAAMIPFFGHSLSTAEETRWRFVRKLMTPSFAFHTLEQRLVSVNDHCDRLIERLARYGDEKPVNLYRYVRPYMYDVFSSTLMGIDSNLLDDPDHPYIVASSKVIKIVTENYFSYWRHIDVIFKLTPYYREMMDVIHELNKKSKQMLQQRRDKIKKIATDISNNNPNIDFNLEEMVKETIRPEARLLDELILNKLPNRDCIPDDMIVEELNLLSFTGHYTTTKTVSHTLYLMAKYPEIQQRVLEEQLAIFGDDHFRKPTTNDLNQMKFLEAVIKETMRYIPTVTKLGRQLHNDLKLKDGRIVPAGTSILVYLEALFNNPDVYPDYDVYRPDRFLDTSTSAFSFVPFSAGPRNCIGFKYAWVAMKATLSTILRNFEVHEGGPGLEPKISYRLITESSNGVHLKLKRRMSITKNTII